MIKLEWETEREWKELLERFSLQSERAYSFRYEIYWGTIVKNKTPHDSYLENWVGLISEGWEINGR